ncbi:Ubiquitin-like domain-containing protein [Caenorhabditis elegans]|uniref:Ubiquitin-like domain-containing protein n=1 Tax=Caenorhabditis elegans TaxID=6239 RepID=G4S0D4_CAEEL|nr:Ubiquitin-like domain-containing protein [Caenorhabditis elegans]CCD64708.1 Ubiquitin-like domain-containing protein [Caenorhabditis elegans]|eukprot:NP_001254076.1 Uncharacterized protein CELE_C16C8.20 [Caenorhabditis elegans]
MSETSSLMSQFQKLRVETSKIYNEFTEEGQDRIMMKIQEGAAVKDVPIESGELAKNDSMFKIFVSWSIPGGIFVSENRRKLPVYESNTIRQIKLRINSLVGIDIGSFSSYCDDKILEDDHTLAHYNISYNNSRILIILHFCSFST